MKLALPPQGTQDAPIPHGPFLGAAREYVVADHGRVVESDASGGIGATETFGFSP